MNKLKEIYAIVQFAIAIGPQLMGFIAEIERVTAESGVIKAGAQKAGLVIGFITAALEMAPADVKEVLHTDKLVQFSQKLIDTVVTFYNAIGIFKK